MKYKVRTSCEVAGTWRNEGDEIEMTPEQAEFLSPPFGNVLAPAEDTKKKPEQDEPGSKQRRG